MPAKGEFPPPAPVEPPFDIPLELILGEARMATQVFSKGANPRQYVVIDNSPAGATIATALGGPSPQLPDGSARGFDESFPGAASQGKNDFANGNIPDAVAGATKTVRTDGVFLRWKNPA